VKMVRLKTKEEQWQYLSLILNSRTRENNKKN
jgi:hypothetical protein